MLPYERTDEQSDAISMADMKVHFAPKKPPPKQYIPPHTLRHFAETREKPVELASDYDRSITRSLRANFDQQKGKQLPSSENGKINRYLLDHALL
jgi:hypothetical protein